MFGLGTIITCYRPSLNTSKELDFGMLTGRAFHSLTRVLRGTPPVLSFLRKMGSFQITSHVRENEKKGLY